MINLSKLKLNPENPRKITKRAMEKLCQSIQNDPEFMELRPIIVDSGGIIWAGNQRFKAIKKLGMKKISDSWVKQIDEKLTDEKKKRFLLVDNSPDGMSGEWDIESLSSFFTIPELNDIGFDSNLFSISDAFQKEKDILGIENEDIQSLGAVYDLKADIKFDGIGKYDFPEVRKDRILQIDDLTVWAGPNISGNERSPFLYNYQTDSTINLPWDKTVVSFYTDDSRFERWWSHTSEIIKRMLNIKILGIFSPNFSTYFNHPKAIRIYNIFRSRWIARYAQEAGILVIPDISCGKSDLDCVCDGIPKKSVIAIQAHRRWD